MKDAASIAERAANENWTTQRITKSINRYAARLVKAERERIIGIVDDEFAGQRKYAAIRIVSKINQAKRPSRRK